MNRPPAFQFYPGDWLSNANVSMMSLEEEGAYIRLLCHCWIEGYLPNDDAKLSMLSKGASTTVVSLVRQRFQPSADDPHILINPRLDRERQKQLAWREKSSVGGRKSAQLRAESSHTKSKGGSSGLVQPNGNSSVFSLQSSSSSNKVFTEPSVPKTKGTRIPENFSVTLDHQRWAKEKGLPSPSDHIEAFCDYWRAKPGAGGVKLDWDATFRTWIRNSVNRKENSNGQGESKFARVQRAIREASGELAD
jgi:uncharacterized protein YdaU (DUF1376 family)